MWDLYKKVSRTGQTNYEMSINLLITEKIIFYYIFKRYTVKYFTNACK